MALETLSVRFDPDDIWRIDESAKKMGVSRGECLRICILLGITQLDGIEAEITKPAAAAFMRILATSTQDQLNLFRELLADPARLAKTP